MRRIMVTVTDMTVPSAPGKQHVYTVSGDDTEAILSDWFDRKS